MIMRFSYTNIIFIFLLACGFLHRSEGCLDEERRLLLQIKDSIPGYRKNIYPLGVWVGENCCEWPGVQCRTPSKANSSSHHRQVVSLDLKMFEQTVTEGVRTWHPDVSLFAEFEHLESLSLNHIGGWWVKPQGLCGMRNLKSLTIYLSDLYDEDIPWCFLTNSSRLEELIFGGNNFRNLDGLCGIRNLKSLDLSSNNLKDQDMPSCLLTNLSKLEELNLGWNNFQSLDGFDQLKRLRVLDLSYNVFNNSFNSLSGLCRMSNLKSLDLSMNNMNDEHIPSCWMNNSSNKLEELSLDGNYLRSLDGLSQMKSLRDLSLWDNMLNESINSLSGLCEMTNLKSLDLAYNNLGGREIGPCLFSKLSKLEILYLNGNKLRNLKGFAQMRSLKMLYLSYNYINSLAGFDELRSLKKLHLRDNSLNASIINSLSGLQKFSNLEELNLQDNQLTDRNIGTWILNLTSLVSLALSYNNLKDPWILKGLCSLRNLRDLRLSGNLIEGQIPTCFKDMYSLQRLDLGNNLLTGEIPPVIFSNLTMMEILDVKNNQLNGMIPFFMFANLSKLYYIDLSNNPLAKVEIEHPHWIPTFQLLVLYLSKCNINSGVPNFLSSQHQLSQFESDYSFLYGPIPAWILYNVSSPLLLSLRGNMLEGPFPHSSQPNPAMLEEIDISDNDINGTLPVNIGELLPMLVHFNASRNSLQGNIPASVGELVMLKTLDLSQNKFSGEISLGLAKNNTTSLTYLDLSNNHFDGQIFARGFNASELLALFLHNNHFNGTIPWSLSNSRSLMFLDVRNNKLAGPIPSWLSLFPSLISIFLSGNYFTGNIPMDFCKMQSLHMLDLSNNNLSGSIPPCLNNITSLVKNSPWFELLGKLYDNIRVSSNTSASEWIRLTMDFTSKGRVYTYEGIPLSMITGLDFSMNRLTSRIPPQLGDLKELHTLNLSNNLLIGQIPESFMYLKNIESLDLSHNKLTGPIPFQLVQLNFLTTFSIAFNNLSGKIPPGSQFNTFNASSYIGNLGLCGPPIERNCSSEDSSQPVDEEKDIQESSMLDILSRPIIFYLWVVFSYALGFSSLCLALIFNANWRWKYFRIVDDYIDSTIERMRKFQLLIRKWL